MAQSIRDVMTPDPLTMPAESSVIEAARAMRDSDIGDVIVTRDGELCGIVTDRDLVVRALADGQDPGAVRLGDVCSGDVTALSPESTVDDAVRTMRDKAIRRLPVVEGGRAVGIVAIGDLAVDRDPGSALADISAAPPNS